MALKYVFPDPLLADKDGLIAAGGDLSIDSLTTAYSRGIFPWFDSGSPILWWCPDPRMVLFPDKLSISSSLRRKIESGKYAVTADTNFSEVIRHCATVRRKGQQGTWITADMQQAYMDMHREGLAHSFETWYDGELVGGLYGVSLGRTFFGESMFHTMNDASKIAFYYLVKCLHRLKFDMIDAQQSTRHLRSLGAEDIPRKRFLKILEASLQSPTLKGSWKDLLVPDHP